MQECSIPSAFIMGMLWACTKASIWCRQWLCAWLAACPWLYLWWPCCTPSQLTLTICVALRWQYVWHMSVIMKYKLIHPVGLLLDCGISSAFATGMLQSCTRPSAECMDSVLVPVWHQVTVSIYDNLMYTHEIDHMCEIDVRIGVIHQCHMQTYISRWLDAGLRYLQCISNGNASVLH